MADDKEVGYNSERKYSNYVNHNLGEIVTPINKDELSYWLQTSGYDKNEAKFLVEGFTNRFDINYNGPVNRKDESKNIPFHTGNKEILWEKIMSEVKERRYSGPFEKPPFENYIQSLLGLVPKANGKMQLIFHLSYNIEMKSVNFHIPHELCTVKYNDLDEAVRQTLSLNAKPVFFAKTDFSNAFRLVPLKISCRKWLLMKAEDPESGQTKYFINNCLPFGSSISCAIFQRISNAVKHIYLFLAKKNKLIIFVINYLDDFLFIHLKESLCNKGVRLFLRLCQDLGLKVAAEKTVWGTTRIVFLGILLDGDNLVLGIPMEKKEKAIKMLLEMVDKKKNTIRNLQGLAGYLNFLNKAIFLGRTFTRRMYSKFGGKLDKLKPHHHVKLEKEFKQDCETWLSFLRNDSWTTVCRPMVDLSHNKEAPELDFFTDTSGSKEKGGFGCIFGENWSYGTWNEDWMKDQDPSIEYLELAALCIGIFMWSSKLKKSEVYSLL